MDQGRRQRGFSALIWAYPLLILFFLGTLVYLGAGRARIADELLKRYRLDPHVLSRVSRHLESMGDPQRALSALLGGKTAPPMPAHLTAQASGPGLVFSHFATGSISPGVAFKSTYSLVNNSTQRSKGSVEFFDDTGNPLVVSIGGTAASSFPFDLEVDHSRRLVTDGTGAVKTGWALIRSEQPMSATSSFGIFNGSQVITDGLRNNFSVIFF